MDFTVSASFTPPSVNMQESSVCGNTTRVCVLLSLNRYSKLLVEGSSINYVIIPERVHIEIPSILPNMSTILKEG